MTFIYLYLYKLLTPHTLISVVNAGGYEGVVLGIDKGKTTYLYILMFWPFNKIFVELDYGLLRYYKEYTNTIR